MNIRENIQNIQTEANHSGAAMLKRLIKVGDTEGKLQTLNFAWLTKDSQIEQHVHPDCTEYYYFLSGSGEMKVGEESLDVAMGDFVTVLPNSPHTVRNHNTEDLKFLTIRVLLD